MFTFIKLFLVNLFTKYSIKKTFAELKDLITYFHKAMEDKALSEDEIKDIVKKLKALVEPDAD